ncbi:MAG: glycosyltransferase [Nitrospirae bacterium]|nr:glycosyltransferase [Nitrospirota bacterium]
MTDLPGNYSSETLNKNLQAIKTVNQLLYERICLPVDGSHIKFENDEMFYRIHKTWYHVSKEKMIFSGAIDSYLEKETVLIFGCGFGFILDELLEKNYRGEITAWERDPWLLRLLLLKRDFSKEILGGNLIFCLGADIFEIADRKTSPSKIATNSFLKEIYSCEYNLIEKGVKEKVAFLCAGELFVEDIAGSFQDMGYSVYTWEHEKIAVEESSYLFTGRKPDVVISVNYYLGLAEFCHRQNVPYICWEIDPSIDILPPVKTPAANSFIFSYRRRNLDEFRNSGFCNLYYLPLAANISKRKPVKLSQEDLKKYGAKVSFLGSSMTDTAKKQKQAFIETFTRQSLLAGEEAEQRAGELFELMLEEQRKDWNNFIIDRLCETYLKDNLASFKISEQGKYDWTMLVGESAASERRLHFVKKLLPFNIDVWGDQGWQALGKDGLNYRGFAGHFIELNKIYNATLINVDIGRFYQKDIITMRVFDVLACGGFIIAEYSEELNELFTIGEDIEAYKTLDELIDKVAYYIGNQQKIKQIAQKGREIVIKRHSIKKRLEEMLEIIEGKQKLK